MPILLVRRDTWYLRVLPVTYGINRALACDSVPTDSDNVLIAERTLRMRIKKKRVYRVTYDYDRYYQVEMHDVRA